MFDSKYYQNSTIEINIKKLQKVSVECRVCFFIFSHEYSDLERKIILTNSISLRCEKIYFFGINAQMWENVCGRVIAEMNLCGVSTVVLHTAEALENELDLEISINDALEKDIVIIYDDLLSFERFRDAFLENEQASYDNWNEKMREPLKPRTLNIDELKQLVKAGRISQEDFEMAKKALS